MIIATATQETTDFEGVRCNFRRGYSYGRDLRYDLSIHFPSFLNFSPVQITFGIVIFGAIVCSLFFSFFLSFKYGKLFIRKTDLEKYKINKTNTSKQRLFQKLSIPLTGVFYVFAQVQAIT